MLTDVYHIRQEEEKRLEENRSLEKAAEMAAEEYRNDKDLTAFCALDGEDFHETR